MMVFKTLSLEYKKCSITLEWMLNVSTTTDFVSHIAFKISYDILFINGMDLTNIVAVTLRFAKCTPTEFQSRINTMYKEQ